MSDGDVHGHEMNGPHDFDDATTEALIAGSGRDVDPSLADLIGDMRVAYTSQPPALGAELAALIETPSPVAAPTPRRIERMRASVFAKIGAATAAVVAATGGLAVAGALPAPVQNAISHLGVGESHSHHSPKPAETLDEETTTTTAASTTDSTVPQDETSTTVEPDNHGDEVSGVAHQEDGSGCEHGHDVAAVASDGKSQGQPCETTTTVGDGTTPTTIEDGQDQSGTDQGDSNGGDQGGDSAGHGHDGTPPTTVAGSSSTDQHGGDSGGSGSGSDGGGDQNSGSNGG